MRSFVGLGSIIFCLLYMVFCCVVSNFGQLHVDIYLDTPRTIPNSLRSRPQPFVDYIVTLFINNYSF